MRGTGGARSGIQGGIVGILQPVYLPWLGYFEQMALADQFVFLDDVQYTHRDWRNRNRIKTSSGAVWLTVPIKRRARATMIKDIEISYEHRWPSRHLKTIEQNYKKCSGFQPFFDDLSQVLLRAPSMLADLDYDLITLMCRYLKIETPTVRASELPGSLSRRDLSPGESPSQRLARVCEHLGASVFYEGARGRNYLDEELFTKRGVSVIYQDFQHPEYPQANGPFLSHMSAIDLIMNVGKAAPDILRSSPQFAQLKDHNRDG